ncbi:hypothetical protein EHP00_1210 [Ecytonucleospora hepatopenaei]|uniref:Uncharacterized protein n=1 Tax=Ecytonucleospora hepatopenaei TaxID=646526 RepID=A0A1W0E821_9MICR|nr:hypothetical protein EHP00_1210 [Ecytonucleospora hepatopenaei]
METVEDTQKNNNETDEFEELNKRAVAQISEFQREDTNLWHFFFYKIKKGEEHWYLPQIIMTYILCLGFFYHVGERGYELCLKEIFIEDQMYIYVAIGTSKSYSDILEFKNSFYEEIGKMFEDMDKRTFETMIDISVNTCSRCIGIYQNFIGNFHKVSLEKIKTCLFIDGDVYYHCKTELK